MKMTWLNLVILALTTHRATRLVVEDTITEPMRRRIQARATTTQRNANGTWLVTDPEKPWIWRKAYELTACQWCVSVWAGGATVALAHFEGSWFKYAAYALAFSTLAGWGTRIG